MIIRRADGVADAKLIRLMSKDLASDVTRFEATASADACHMAHLFETKQCIGLIAYDDDDGEPKVFERPIGYSFLYFEHSLSPVPRKSLFMEDLYLATGARGKQLGLQLMDAVYGVARECGCHRVAWGCEAGNKMGMRFYAKIGATDRSITAGSHRYSVGKAQIEPLLKSKVECEFEINRIEPWQLNDYISSIHDFMSEWHLFHDAMEQEHHGRSKPSDFSEIGVILAAPKCTLVIAREKCRSSVDRRGEPDIVGIAFAHTGYNGFTDWRLDTLMIDTLYVAPPFRQKGVGKVLFQSVARAAIDKGCAGVEWYILDPEHAANAAAVKLSKWVGAKDWFVGDKLWHDFELRLWL